MDQTTLRWISFAFEILQVVAALFGLWLAAGIILDQVIDSGALDESDDWDDEEDGSSEEIAVEVEADDEAAETVLVDESTALPAAVDRFPRVSRPVALVLWLVLAGLFYLPLSDLFSGLRTAVFLGLGWSQMAASPVANTWGVIEQGIYFLATLVLMVVIYGIVLIVGWKFVSPNSDSVFADLPLSGLERFFILLGMAALVHYMVRNVILTLTWLELPTTTGQPTESALAFLAPAIIVLAVLLLIILWMSYAISRRELELEDELEDDLEDEFEDELDDQLENESEEELEDELEEDEDKPTE